eukprot:883387-Lingulodinium_polyedra.AAC.1
MVHVQIHVSTHTQDRLNNSPSLWQRQTDEGHARAAPRLLGGWPGWPSYPPWENVLNDFLRQKTEERQPNPWTSRPKLAPTSASGTPGN